MKIKKGDYFLMPYAGSRRDNLVRVVKQLKNPSIYFEVYYVRSATRKEKMYRVYLGSCRRVSPSLAKRILGRGR